MDYHIRTAEFNDLHWIAPLFDAYRQFYGQAPNLSMAKVFMGVRLKQKDSQVLLALSNSIGIPNVEPEALGFAQMYPSFSSIAARPILILNDLYVIPAARGKGVAQALLLKAKEYAQQVKAKRVTLAAGRDNAAAQALYESLGFRPQKGFLHYDLELD